MARAEEQSVSSIPGTRFEVDNFKSRPKQSSGASTELRYFVTHAHSDHFRGLTEAFSDGPIHCSELTAEVVHIKTGVPWRMLSPLPMDKPTFLDGVEVILVDANHCPGAVQLLFRLPDGRSFIHTGDMRFHQSLKHNPHLQRFRFCSQLFLDTTYCNQRYSFPSQEESVEYVASQISSAFSLSNSPPLVVVCTYGIGKERILLEVRSNPLCRARTFPRQALLFTPRSALVAPVTRYTSRSTSSACLRSSALMSTPSSLPISTPHQSTLLAGASLVRAIAMIHLGCVPADIVHQPSLHTHRRNLSILPAQLH